MWGSKHEVIGFSFPSERSDGELERYFEINTLTFTIELKMTSNCQKTEDTIKSKTYYVTKRIISTINRKTLHP